MTRVLTGFVRKTDGVGSDLARSIRRQVDGGEVHEYEGLLTIFKRTTELARDHRQTARRRRIERQLLRIGITSKAWIGWHREVAGMNKLENMRHNLSWCKFSDDEEEADTADSDNNGGEYAKGGKGSENGEDENEDSEEDIEHSEEENSESDERIV